MRIVAEYFFMFMLYSIGGWIMETLLFVFRDKKVVNRTSSTNIGLEYITDDIEENGNIIHVADITKKQFNGAGYHDVEVYHTNEINKYTFYIPEKTRIRYWVSSKVLTSTPIYVKLFIKNLQFEFI